MNSTARVSSVLGISANTDWYRKWLLTIWWPKINGQLVPHLRL